MDSDKRKVSWTKEGSLGVVVIDSPPVNALGDQVIRESLECFREMGEDPEVRVVIVTGAGEKAFVAGADIRAFPRMMQGKAGLAAEFAREAHQTINAVDFFPKPTIAAIDGLALGGGCELALACDIRVASGKALFGLPEIKLGLFPGGGGTQRLPRLIGEAKAKELMYLGDFIGADEALRIGLVNRVVAPGEALEAAKALGNEIASRPGVALGLIKQCVNRGMQMTLEEGLNLEIDLFDRVFLSEDVKEGVSAFLEKKPAKFKHC